MSLGERLHQSIFESELSTITVAGVTVPVKFGISALDEIQSKYGSLEEYELALKEITSDKKTVAKNMVRKNNRSVQPVMDGIIAMVHCGCKARGLDLTGTTDQEILGALDGQYYKLRNLVIAEFNKNFIEPDDDEKPKKATRTRRSR